jgi:hypothetical protein
MGFTQLIYWGRFADGTHCPKSVSPQNHQRIIPIRLLGDCYFASNYYIFDFMVLISKAKALDSIASALESKALALAVSGRWSPKPKNYSKKMPLIG